MISFKKLVILVITSKILVCEKAYKIMFIKDWCTRDVNFYTRLSTKPNRSFINTSNSINDVRQQLQQVSSIICYCKRFGMLHTTSSTSASDYRSTNVWQHSRFRLYMLFARHNFDFQSLSLDLHSLLAASTYFHL